MQIYPLLVSIPALWVHQPPPNFEPQHLCPLASRWAMWECHLLSQYRKSVDFFLHLVHSSPWLAHLYKFVSWHLSWIKSYFVYLSCSIWQHYLLLWNFFDFFNWIDKIFGGILSASLGAAVPRSSPEFLVSRPETTDSQWSSGSGTHLYRFLVLEVQWYPLQRPWLGPAGLSDLCDLKTHL